MKKQLPIEKAALGAINSARVEVSKLLYTGITPYKAIAEEKFNYFQKKFSDTVKTRIEQAEQKELAERSALEQRYEKIYLKYLPIVSKSKAFKKYDLNPYYYFGVVTTHKKITKIIRTLEINLPRAEKAFGILQRRKDKQDVKKAQYATSVDESRNLAQRIKRALPSNHKCPYCDGPLGENYHADHIYPVSKGGQSRESNMVNVCETCNLKKKDDTLNTFIIKYGLYRDSIERNLIKLGKEI